MTTKAFLLSNAAIFCVALTATAANSAEADWQEYVFEEFGVAKEFPLAPERSEIVYAAPETSRDEPRIAGESRPSVLYRTELDGVSYRMEIVDVSDDIVNGANIFSECLYLAGQSGEEISNVHLGVGGEDSEVFGRLSEVDLSDDQGHLLTACFYNAGKLYRVEAHIPEGGNTGSPQAYRYMSTIRFDLSNSYE